MFLYLIYTAWNMVSSYPLLTPAVLVEGPTERTSEEAGKASEHEPLRQ